MKTNEKIHVSPAMQKQILTDVYIEKIDDVLAEYVALFCKHPRMRNNKTLLNYYSELGALVRNIRFGINCYNLTEVDTYLKKAYAEKVKAEVFA